MYNRPIQKILQYTIGNRYSFMYNGKMRTDALVVDKMLLSNCIRCEMPNGDYRTFNVGNIKEEVQEP